MYWIYNPMLNTKLEYQEITNLNDIKVTKPTFKIDYLLFIYVGFIFDLDNTNVIK